MPFGDVFDPALSVGRFKVLARMDGRIIAYDPEKPLGKRTIALFKTVDGCAGWLENLTGLKREKT